MSASTAARMLADIGAALGIPAALAAAVVERGQGGLASAFALTDFAAATTAAAAIAIAELATVAPGEHKAPQVVQGTRSLTAGHH
eukprot:m.56966 g.56966  ORF g.56966 m.56966 type:complete len:85 (-) comp6804_c0_seq1:1464-1718(-)